MRDKLIYVQKVPDDMSQDEFLKNVCARHYVLRLCSVCGSEGKISVAVDMYNIVSALVICPFCHNNVLSKKGKLKSWSSSVGEAVDDWNSHKGDESLCLPISERKKERRSSNAEDNK